LATDSATGTVRYLTYAEAVTLHIMLMRRLGETRFGAFDRQLVESALARPRHAAAYEGADLIRPHQKSPLGRRQQAHGHNPC
jgi:hypothetical protein